MSLRRALLQPNHSSQAPALVVWFEVIQYQTHRKQSTEGHTSQQTMEVHIHPQAPQVSTHVCQ